MLMINKTNVKDCTKIINWYFSVNTLLFTVEIIYFRTVCVLQNLKNHHIKTSYRGASSENTNSTSKT
jgi:hypothetical protein